jgi:tryptophan-rich sensory protein
MQPRQSAALFPLAVAGLPLILAALLLAACAHNAPPISACFLSPYLYCPPDANGDGDP